MSTGGNRDRKRNLSRREFIGIGGMSTAALLLGTGALPGNRVLARPRFPDYPFKLGVASGDPLPGGVVLWTRLAPEPLAEDGSGGMIPESFGVRYEVAEDENFRRIVRRGAVEATPELGHSVHAEVSELLPAREYFYRFKAGPEISPTGRTRTAPASGAAVGSMRFAFASCQAWADGLYTAYGHMAREDLDLVVHLGDYIYEGGRQSEVRGHLPAREIFSLEDYRVRHAQYRTDEHLRAAHAAFPWVITLDDHDVENNWAGEVSQPDSEPDQDPEVFLRRRAAAFQAFYEHLPLRIGSRPSGPDMQLYRRLAYGNLAEFNVLDGRQYRDDQVCGDGRRIGCEERLDPSRTMLGDEQERWLLEGLAGSDATWKVVANQVFIMQADSEYGPEQAFGMDTWDGYAAARRRLFSGVLDRGVENFVVITGDAHRSVAAELKENFDDPDSATVGAEFLGTSISSGGNGADMDYWGQRWLDENSHMKFHNAQRGYVRCTLTPEQYRADYRTVPYVTGPGAPVYTRASFVVEDGIPGLQQVDSNPVQGQRFSRTFEGEVELDAARARRGQRRRQRRSRP